MRFFPFWNKKKEKSTRIHVRMPYCAAVVAAAGSSARMEGVDKLLAEIGGEPVLLRTLRTLEQSQFLQEIVVVTREELLETVSTMCHEAGLKKVICVMRGGQTRLDSVLAGLGAVSERAKLVAIHDGARPFVSAKVIRLAVMKAAETGAAAPAVPLHDTVKSAVGGIVTQTPERDSLFAVQTPQVFDRKMIQGALQQAKQNGWPVTDDCSAAERIGMRVSLTEGDERNLKITTRLDLKLAEAILSEDPA